MDKVTVLMSTYNGEKYLNEQINSLLNQIEVKIRILVRDDGSTDNTKKILEKFSEEGLLDWYEGENLKPAYSFLDLVKNAPESDYYAFCDQDDYWMENKLSRAINMMKKYNDEEPIFYFSKAQIVDENLNPVKYNNYPKKPYSLGGAIIRNNVTGCTVVFNKKMLEILNLYKPDNIAMHDQWSYLVCKAVNGNIIFDKDSFIKYRQHSTNFIGASIYNNRMEKIRTLFENSNIRWKQSNELLKGYYDYMTRENRLLLNKIKKYKCSFINRLSLAFDIRMYTFTKYDFVFIIKCILGKI